MTENGNGSLTREVLRAEIKAGLATQSIALTKEMEARFRPVNEHIARVDRGEFTTAQKDAIMHVVDSARDHRIDRKAAKMPIFAIWISVIGLTIVAINALANLGILSA